MSTAAGATAAATTTTAVIISLFVTVCHIFSLTHLNATILINYSNFFIT